MTWFKHLRKSEDTDLNKALTSIAHLIEILYEFRETIYDYKSAEVPIDSDELDKQIEEFIRKQDDLLQLMATISEKARMS